MGGNIHRVKIRHDDKKTNRESMLERASWINLGILIAGTQARLLKMTLRTSVMAMQ